MRLGELIAESASGGSTSSGSIATVNVPVGGMRRRGVYGEGGHYTGEPPADMKRNNHLGEEPEIKKGPSPQFSHMNAVRYEMDGGHIDIVEDSPYSPTTSSIIDFVVDEDRRGQGIGQKLLQHIGGIYPDIGGQVSSKASLVAFYKTGFRSPNMQDGSMEEHMDVFNEDHSLFMAKV